MCIIIICRKTRKLSYHWQTVHRLANSGFEHSGTPFPPSPPSFSPPLPPSLSMGVPPLNPARGSGERRKLPMQWGMGRSPSRQTIWCISEPKGAALVATVFVHFCPYIHARWSIFHISGTKWASPRTRDTVGQFQDDPGHCRTVGKANRASHLCKQLLLMHDLEKYFGSAFERSSKISSSDDRLGDCVL